MKIGAGIKIGPGIALRIPTIVGPDLSWDLTYAKWDGFIPSLGPSAVGDFAGLAFSNTQDHIYLLDQATDGIREVYLSNGIASLNGNALNAIDFGVGSAGSFNQLAGLTTNFEPTVTGLDFKVDGTVVYFLGAANTRVQAANLTVAWDTKTATFWNSYAVNPESAVPQSLRFRDDGTSMYIVSSNPDAVFQYNLSSAWNIATASNVARFDTRVEETNPSGLAFSNDGSKMYVVGTTLDRVYQYNLSTAWLVATASYYANVSVGTQESNPFGVHFGDNGRFMYITGLDTNGVRRYYLDTPWDVTTANTSNSTVSQAVTEANPYDLYVRDNGNDIYVIGVTADGVYRLSTTNTWSVVDIYPGLYLKDRSADPPGLAFSNTGGDVYVVSSNPRDEILQYSMSTPWRARTATFTANITLATLGIGAETSPTGIAISPDSSNLYIVGNQTDSVFQLQMSTQGNVLTASNVGVFSVSSQSTTPQDISFNSTGTKMYLVDSVADILFEYNLSAAWNIATASYTGLSANLAAYETTSLGITRAQSNLYFIGTTSDRVHRFMLDAQDSLQTGDFNYRIITSDESVPYSLALSNVGDKLYTLGEIGDQVDEYQLSPNYSLRNARLLRSFNVGAQVGTTPLGLSFSADGTRMYVGSFSNQNVFQYNLSAAWNVATAVYYANYRLGYGVGGVHISPDSSNLFVTNLGTDTVWRYPFSTPGNLTTISNANNFVSVGTQAINPYQAVFKPDGTRMFVVDQARDNVYQYNLSSAWNVATAVYTNVLFNGTVVDSSLHGIAFSNTGLDMFLVGNTRDIIIKVPLKQ